MKKRILIIIVTLFLCVGLALPTFAEESAPSDTVTDTTDTTEEVTEETGIPETTDTAEMTEQTGPMIEETALSPETAATTVTEAPETLVDELPDGIENVEKEQLLEIIKGLSGEGVDKIQELLLAGINSVERGQSTLWDKVADFCERHIEAISLIAFAIVGILYIFVRVKSNKKLRNDIGIATNNAVETVEIAKQMNADSVAALQNAAARVDSFKETLDASTNEIKALLAETRQKTAEDETLRSALKHNSDADMLLADTVNELLQLANIPQNKKDAIYSKVTAAKALIKAEVETNEGKDKETDKASIV